MSEYGEIMNVNASILPPSRWESWLMIKGVFTPEYHKCGDYYQTDLDCVILDGCTDIKKAVLALTTNGNEYEQLEQLRLDYQPGRIFKISAEYFSISSSGAVTFYGNPELEQLGVTVESIARRWFESASQRINCPVTERKTGDSVTGKVVSCNVLLTKSGQEMACVKLDSDAAITLTIFPEQYAEYKNVLAHKSVLTFYGSITGSTGEASVMVVDAITSTCSLR